MKIPLNNPDIELLTKIAGLVGSVIGVTKVVVPYVNDLSFKRKMVKAAADIDTLLPQVERVRSNTWQRDGSLESYRLHIEEELQDKLNRLAGLKAEVQFRAARRNEEPRGIRRWLLLYRPEGFNGLSIQSLFYFSLMVMFLGAWWLYVSGGIFTLLSIPFVLLGLGGSLFMRSTALRVKTVRNAMRKNGLSNPNNDLDGFHWVFALYAWRDGQWFSRAVFYLLLLAAVCLQISWIKSLASDLPAYDVRSWQTQIFYTLCILLAAQVFRVDALSRRAKERLFSESVSAAVAVAEASPMA